MEPEIPNAEALTPELSKPSMARLSNRGVANMVPDAIKAIMKAGSSNPHHPQHNADGIVSLGVAENRLLHAGIAQHVSSHMHVSQRMLTYGDGSVGSDVLRQAIADFINDRFQPVEPLGYSSVTVLNGVSAVLDSLAWCICDEGDSILIGKPFYVGFVSDFMNRAKVDLVAVTFGEVDPMSLAAVAHYERAMKEAVTRGKKLKALVLCSPHNPLGRCYTPEVLEAYLRLCSKYWIHMISDEVYAMSVFPNGDIPNPVPFRSVLSLEYRKLIDPSLLHVLYGMSKDFCANGLRIGAFISTTNPELHAAMRAISKFAWSSSLADLAWSSILSDGTFLQEYLIKITARLTEAYNLCTSILRGMNVPYLPANSGPFLWINLSGFLEHKTIESERDLAWQMIKAGVWLATGEAYRSEEPGWFRLTFAVSETEIRMGLERYVEQLVGYGGIASWLIWRLQTCACSGTGQHCNSLKPDMREPLGARDPESD
ncbi:hypothetical protein HO133_000127 [Letharia lupina]|uniref:Aminotransferase class I/classII large domain-containing protein n=1 Tax=Letharia lupina TaxID=560253 RepID=A0A8H6CH62_9LECA|nr:uncharacterized protein HO133_000127 [Letharia lupina]KAF6223285.1 hypothetical protein HO133_000127 [Letharia lupina]